MLMRCSVEQAEISPRGEALSFKEMNGKDSRACNECEVWRERNNKINFFDVFGLTKENGAGCEGGQSFYVDPPTERDASLGQRDFWGRDWSHRGPWQAPGK